jgi:hypothetical protein
VQGRSIRTILIGFLSLWAAGATTTALASVSTAKPVDLRFCLDETNRYRVRVGARAVASSSALEQYADRAARSDGLSKTPHGYTTRTNFGDGIITAENEVPWWPLSRFSSVQAVIRTGLAMFWKEGPKGAHYRNMTHAAYTEAGCGVFIKDGEITIVQVFR